MLRELRVRKIALALVLALVAGAAAHAQLVATPAPVLPGYCDGGPIRLTAGEGWFNLALDDAPFAPAMDVTLRVYDSEGRVVAEDTTTLAAGKTTTLGFRGSGTFRLQATFTSLANPSKRRRTTALGEVVDNDNLRLVIPVMCFPNERIVN